MAMLLPLTACSETFDFCLQKRFEPLQQ